MHTFLAWDNQFNPTIGPSWTSFPWCQWWENKLPLKLLVETLCSTHPHRFDHEDTPSSLPEIKCLPIQIYSGIPLIISQHPPSKKCIIHGSRGPQDENLFGISLFQFRTCHCQSFGNPNTVRHNSDIISRIVSPSCPHTRRVSIVSNLQSIQMAIGKAIRIYFECNIDFILAYGGQWNRILVCIWELPSSW